ncbi:MAG: hypothetical protein A2293_01310 [Elusimicrobia bacterium RIFOXYB2_FULL_49_7]|nr:MAG: hypothetical protein A2293_01310 [Elusimicrobia bacterium RIFOXYB2_FULL_49_7]
MATGREKKKILLADDEKMLVKMFKDAFSEHGYEVFACHDGNEAVKVYKKQWKKIALSIIDLDMPKKNGMECIADMRALNPDAKIIVISAFSDFRSEVNEVKEKGFVFLRKPFHLDDLIVNVKKMIAH